MPKGPNARTPRRDIPALQVDRVWGCGRYLPKLAGGTLGDALSVAEACAWPTCAADCLFAAKYWLLNAMAMNITLRMITYIMARELFSAPAFGDASRDAGLKLAFSGKSAIKRTATIPESRCANGCPGSAAINPANLRVALARDIRAKLAASCQGSISSRANAERTLSRVPLPPSSTEAYRKSSNSDRN